MKPTFKQLAVPYSATIAEMRKAAYDLHASVNQTYGPGFPYSVHLGSVLENTMALADDICTDAKDVLPVCFGALFHDSIEDARVTYNDVLRKAKEWMDDEQSVLAAEIVYALTNEKGRTRAERANDKYYAGIRAVPYAPLVKLADRVANTTFSMSEESGDQDAMLIKYRNEWPHFIQSISPEKGNDDHRFSLPDISHPEIAKINLTNH